MREPRWVGRDVPQIDTDDKLSGATAYLGDLALPRMLHGAIVRSPVPHGRIRGIDLTRARKVPGVQAVVTAADAPHVAFGPYTPDWEILARHKVRFVGDEVAAVAATTPEAAREAAALVTLDIEELPAVFDPALALAEGAPVIWDEHPDNVSTLFTIERGDVTAAFDRADLVFEDTYATNRIYHAYLEPIGAIAAYEHGSYLMHVPTHIPYRARLTYAAALGVDVDRVRIVVPPIGGSFGAKYEMNTPLIAALLARQAGRPVRILFDREEDAAVAHPRPPFVFQHRIAVGSDGTFLGRQTDVIGVAGARTYWSPTVVATAVHRVDSLYRFGAMSGRGRLIYTNENPTTCMRGFGNAEALFGIEQMIDDIAAKLGHDPVDIRLRNAVREGETTIHGWHISSSKLPQCIERVQRMSGYPHRPRTPAEATGTPGGVARGMGLAIGHHVSGYRTILGDYDGSSAFLRLGADGDVSLYVGEPDIGQGQRTVLAQIVAEKLGLDPGRMSVHGVDSALSPAAVGTLASRATTMAGMATLAAADDARAKLTAFAAAHWGIPATDVTFDDGVLTGTGTTLPVREALRLYGVANCGLPLLATGVHHPPTTVPDKDKYGNPSAAYPFAAHVAEVEVDLATGQVTVTGYWAAHDSGTVINPATARGQVIGAVAQGIGWALMEDVVLRDGVVRNPNFLDYRIPGAGDIPDVQVEFVDGYEPNGPYGAKSVAEAAINPVVAAIANAVHNATGHRFHELPITAERVFWRLHGTGPNVGSPA
ncbi:xanthine dehydrogenase family protein molybdopterin-binding subunit [Streptosporangium sp. NPDC051022]|uniref:xanthine dehydrogenase family protein molybdopterin-binding subunit n=1 Tax=Streptosporangium sp. NPDC051022 TaxID=3155752 RepID=UPI00343C8BDC